MAVTAPHAERNGTSEGAATKGAATGGAATEGAALKARLDEADAELDLLDPDRYSVEDTAEIVTWLTRHERRVLAAKSLAMARVAQGNLYLRSGHRSAAEALAAATGDSVGETKDLIGLGENLANQPELAASFKQGKLSRWRAAQVSKAAKVNPSREADLVGHAEKDSDATLREECQRAKSEGRSGEDEARHFQRLHEGRTCRTWTDDDGAFRLLAVVTPEVGAGVLAALDAQTDRHFRKARNEGRFENLDAYRADALAALLTGKGLLGPKGRTGNPGAGTGPVAPTSEPAGPVACGPSAAGSGPSGPSAAGPGPATPDAAGSEPSTPGAAGPEPAGPGPSTPDPSAPDAAGPGPSGGGGPGGGSVAGNGSSLVVVADLETLRGGKVVPGGRCEIPGVGPVPVETARALLGDALVELIIAHGTDVTTVYSAGRHIPRRVRSALMFRDPRCVVPGCDARLGLENDHWVTDFAKGGLTSLDNLARICKRHHRDRTHHGFTLDKEGDTWVWTPPPFPVAPKTRPRRRPRGRPKAPPATDQPTFDDVPPPRQE
jgi:hypothetical protein